MSISVKPLAASLTYFTLLATCLDAYAVDIDNFSTEVRLDYALETSSRRGQRKEIQILPQLDLRVADVNRIRTSLRIRYDTSYPLGDQTLNQNYTAASELWRQGDHSSVELRDFYWERPIGSAQLRFGKQQIVWGALDGIKLLDVLNPQSFQTFILEDFSDSRISLWSAYLEMPIGDARLELMWAPDSSSHELPARDSSFSLRASRFRFGFSKDENTSTPKTSTVRDSDAWDDATFGARLSSFYEGWDLAASIVAGNDHLPVGTLNTANVAPVLESHYEHRVIYGLSAQKSFGALTFRSEAALRSGKAFNTLASTMDPTSLRIEKSDQLGVAAAIDWNAPADIFVNVQLIYDKVLDLSDGLVRPVDETLMTFYASRKFYYDTFELELRWYTIFGSEDELIRPALRYDIGDNTSVRLGLDYFRGSSEGVFGQFEDASRMLISLAHVF